MSSPRRPLRDEALPGARDWAEFDGDLDVGEAPQGGPTPGAASLGDLDLDAEPGGDFDLGATLSRAGLLRPSAFGHRRRSHALSAAGAALAMVLALAIHAASEAPSSRRAPSGTGTFAHVTRTVAPRGHARRTRLPEPPGAPRARVSAAARVPDGRPAVHSAPVAPAVQAPAPRVTRAVQPAVEFGFEQ